MKRLAVELTLAVVAAISFAVPAAASSAAPSTISIHMLSVGPKTVKPAYSAKHGWSKCIVSVHTQVRGVKLTSYFNLSKKPVAGKGNIEIYKSSVPNAAYSQATVAPNWLEELGTANFDLCLNPGQFGGKPGKHTLVIAIGKTNGVLYGGVNTVRLTVDVK